ncbi:MAG: hypothetical protein RR101_03975 [Burkholderiaceae bacterium]
MTDAFVPTLASILLRVAFVALFLANVIPKFSGGAAGVVKYFEGEFTGSWLPAWIVDLIARLSGPVELLIVLWLATGVALPWGWFFAGLWCVSLAFGMAIAGKYADSARDFIYVGLATAGLMLSPFDPFRLAF